MTIIRTPTFAGGGLTPDELARMRAHSALWIARAMRTEPADPAKIVPAIHGLYRAAGLKAPRVVIVPSPLVMAFAYGASAAIWHQRSTRSATDAATRDATYAATYAATDAATYAATDAATYAATRDATDAATRAATRAATAAATAAATDACVAMAGTFGLACAKRWAGAYQGGNMWAAWDCYLTAARDVLGLKLPAFENFAHWEAAAIHGGFRVMHAEFCMVSDFPEAIRVDSSGRPHCETGPSHRWRDGWSLYHWHGVRVPAHWIEDRESLDPGEVLREPNVERRAAGCQIIGWGRMAAELDRRIIDGDPDTDIGALVELTLPGVPEPGRFLQAVCPRNGSICEGVPRISDIDGLPIETAVAAQAWRDGLPAASYSHPPIRT